MGVRCVVETVHGGSEWCVREATPDELDDSGEETFEYGEACEVAADVAREHGMRWFDFTRDGSAS